MRILWIINVPNSRTGGAARHVNYLRLELAKLGHQLDPVFAEDVADPLGWLGLTGVTFQLLVPFTISRLTRAHGRYDIVTIHTLAGSVYVFLRKIFRRLPKCVIVSCGSDELRWELQREEEGLGYIRLGWKEKLFYYNLMVRPARYAIRHADHFMPPATCEKEYYTRRYGMDADRITVVPSGVSQEFFHFREYDREPTKLLYLGGWECRKGIRYLVEAFTAVAQEFGDVTLSIVGTGQVQADVAHAFPQSVRGRIRVIPRVAAEDVPKVYATHDIFVLPTLFEGLPLVIPEAMGSGMPIVTTRACGMQDIIEDGVTGFLVPPRDSETLAKSVRVLLKDPLLCAKLGNAAQQKAKEITWDKIAKQTLEVYERLLNGSQ